MKRFLTLFLFIASLSGAVAQERLIREESFSKRRDSIRNIPDSKERVRVIQRAGELGIPLRRVYPDGRFVSVRRFRPNGKPEYLSTFNLNAAGTLSTNKVWKDGTAGLDLSGDGMVVGVWDGGVLRDSHREFGARGRIMNTDADVGGHSTHVSGTIAAEGIDGDARGMANKVIIEAYDWDNDLQEMDAAAAEGLLISNHSYGYIVGFDYNSDEERWEWWGDTDISEEEDYLFGYYHDEAQGYDQVAFDNPFYLMVKSAGNDRGEGPEPGAAHYVWESGDWVFSTAVRQIDGGEDGYGSIGPVASAKNILAVGAVEDLSDGFTGPDGVTITDYSVFGPTDDGRIKPDLVSNGTGLYSSYSGNDFDYRFSSGTSMAAPGVSGSMALLQEHYHNIYNDYLRASSLRGLVLHTADDAGNPGPDYIYGWGLMNTEEAANVISDTLRNQVSEYVLADHNELRIPFYSDGSQALKATICWTDPAGDVPPPFLNPTDRILVNDLDVRVVRKVDEMEFMPFVLDPDQPTLTASYGDNILDNTEQVLLETAEKGFYEIVISHKGELRNLSQDVSLIISGITGEYFASGVYHLKDNNGAFYLTSANEYQPGMEAAWLITPENGQTVSLSFNFFDTEENRDFLRVYDGADGDALLLAEFSGTLENIDTLLVASGDSMWITFSSDDQVQGSGFSAAYCTTVPASENFSIRGESWPCVASVETYFVSGEDGTLFRWYPPEGWDVLETGENYAKIGIASGGGLMQVLAYNHCGESEPLGMVIDSEPYSPRLDNYTGDSLLCSGDTGTLSVEKYDGAVYEWMLPLNWKGSSDSSLITFISSLDQGEVLVSARNSCGSGDTLIIPVLVKTVPGGSPIYSVSDNLCQDASSLFYLVPDDGVDYQWSVESGWVIPGEAGNDTVAVMVGANAGSVYVKASNECGYFNFSRFFIVSPQPDVPLLMDSESIYNDLRSLEVQNSTAYTMIQWYRNGILIDSPLATGPRYVAYIPGVYSVGVGNREGCSLIQESTEGIDVSSQNNNYSVHAGADGMLIINNETDYSATLNVYNLEGKLQLLRTLDPGYNEINTTLQGVQLVSVHGTIKRQVFRIFLR